MKKLLTLLTFFLCFSCFAEKITLPVCGLMTESKVSVPIDVEWNEKWFGKNPATCYNHGLARIASILSTVSYVEIADNKDFDNELVEIYKKFGVKSGDIELHYELDYTNPVWGNDQVAFSIASKQIDSAIGKKTLIFLVIRGTPLNANEWISNVNVSDKTQDIAPIHEGFSHAAEMVHYVLCSYMLKKKINIDDTFLFVTGHSRGAAVANMLSAVFNYSDLIDTSNIYTYTFAAPNVTTFDIEKNPDYDYIWNIISAEDIVPTVPMNRRSWTYKKYGRTKTIVNYYNCNRRDYDENYYPRMNEIYKKFLLRDYCPFYLGPFLPVQITDIATNFNDSVKTYYRGFSGLRSAANTVFKKIFPPIIYKPLEQQPDVVDEKVDSKLTSILEYINKKTDGLGTYAMNAFVDMHAAEAYMSWLLALEENELYSVMPYSQIVIEGNFDGAVFNKNGDCVVKIENGHASLSTLKYKTPARSLFPMGVVIAVPGNEEFDVYVTKDSFFNTSSTIRIEHFRADGVFEIAGPKIKVSPHTGKMYHFKAGKVTYFEDTISYDIEKGRKNMFKRMESAGVTPRKDVLLRFEHALDTNLYMDAGFQWGCQNIYASFLVGQQLNKWGKQWGFDLGTGTQRNLHGFLNLDSELLGKFRWVTVDTGKNNGTFNFVPSVRFGLSLKPVKRFHIFMAGMFDFEIDRFNNAAFDSRVYTDVIPAIPLGTDVRAFPSVQFGMKF